VPHPLPGNHGGGGGTTAPASSNAGEAGGGVVSQVSDFVQNLFKSLANLLGGNAHSAASSGSGAAAASGDDKPTKVNEARTRADDQAGTPTDVDRLAVGGPNSDRRARRQGHSQPTVDDVVFSVQAGVSRVIGSVVRH
jgi:hypothetical protein